MRGLAGTGVRRVQRRVLTALVLSLVLSLTAAFLTACGDGSTSERELVWSDEFDGANGDLPDPEKWELEEFADATDDEKQCYTDSSASTTFDATWRLSPTPAAMSEQTAMCTSGSLTNASMLRCRLAAD